MINLSETWTNSYPEACVGLLAIKNAPNQKDHPGFKISQPES